MTPEQFKRLTANPWNKAERMTIIQIVKQSDSHYVVTNMTAGTSMVSSHVDQMIQDVLDIVDPEKPEQMPVSVQVRKAEHSMDDVSQPSAFAVNRFTPEP